MSKVTYKGKPWQGVFGATGKALDALIKNPSPALFYIVALLAAEILSIVVFGMPDENSVKDQLNFGMIQGLISFLLAPFIIRYQLEIAAGKTASSISELLANPASLYLKLFASVFVIFPLVAVGLLGLLIPLIWFIPWLSLLYFIMVKDGVGPIVALKTVRKLLSGHLGKAWAIVGMSIVLSVCSVAVASVPGLETIVSTAISLIYNTVFAMLFLWLLANPDGDVAAEEVPVPKV